MLGFCDALPLVKICRCALLVLLVLMMDLLQQLQPKMGDSYKKDWL